MARWLGVKDQRLTKEIEKLKKIEKSEIRMIESEKQVFRRKHMQRNKQLSRAPANAASSASKVSPFAGPSQASDVYDTHNNVRSQASLAGDKNLHRPNYDFDEDVLGMIFTDGDLDIYKILCLHLLTAHCVDIDRDVFPTDGTMSFEELLSSCCEDGSNEIGSSSSGSNGVGLLPRYIVEIQPEEMCLKRLEEEQLEEEQLQQQYEESRQLQAPSALGKMPIITPNLHDNLADADSYSLGCTLKSFRCCGNEAKPATSQGEASKESSASKLTNSPVVAAATAAVAKDESSANKAKTYLYFQPAYAANKINNDGSPRVVLVFINSQLQSLLGVIFETLQSANPSKFQDFFRLLTDPPEVNGILQSSESSLFLRSLGNSYVVLSPDNYTFTWSIAFHDDCLPPAVGGKAVLAKNLHVGYSRDLKELADEIKKNVFTHMNAQIFSKIKPTKSPRTSSPAESRTPRKYASKRSIISRDSLSLSSTISQEISKSDDSSEIFVPQKLTNSLLIKIRNEINTIEIRRKMDLFVKRNS